MEVLDMVEPVVYPQKNGEIETEKQRFGRLWKNSITGDEFVRRAHKHIEEWWNANRNGNCNKI